MLYVLYFILGVQWFLFPSFMRVILILCRWRIAVFLQINVYLCGYRLIFYVVTVILFWVFITLIINPLSYGVYVQCITLRLFYYIIKESFIFLACTRYQTGFYRIIHVKISYSRGGNTNSLIISSSSAQWWQDWTNRES